MAERKRKIVKGPNGFGSVRTLDVFRRDTVSTKNIVWTGHGKPTVLLWLIQVYSMLNNLCNKIKCIAYMIACVCVRVCKSANVIEYVRYVS